MEPSNPTKPLVLCVEDDPVMGMLLIYNLEKAGFIAVSVEDGHSALRVIKQIKPQLVILDWTIPRLSGLQVLKWIRHSVLLDNLPVLMVTGRGEKEDRKLALEQGATAFFAKPFSLADLIDAVRRHALAPTRSNALRHEPLDRPELLTDRASPRNPEKRSGDLGLGQFTRPPPVTPL